ncbi:oligopeptide/dipeptide ABC transporter ATP-binding protein [Crossiella equi]|uniref:Oligopeptide/dipeptide ABC transporter ATP-binding protein n=1 Tax=Crossiella equi TaxID=130796 RepID=A0ABS5ALN7_9PSEU|nr:dipeptide/oligopeptide/nickel ABC transporter permease/ATP-binding protein [Crossiella equi]MBP2477473.1 oligopeptide/dipeptide ABC transporter ATP-binding protein [Crossiella equi]
MSRAVRAFLRAPSGVAAVVGVLLLVAVAVLGPVIWGEAAERTNLAESVQGVSGAHLLGTDALGRDVLARTLAAARLSLVLAVVSVAIGASIGLVFGAVLAVLGQRLRGFGMRVIDVLLGLPDLLLGVIVITIVGPGVEGAVAAVAVAFIPGFARMAATLAASVGGQDYLAAARVLGVGRLRLLTRYILPNIAETVTVSVFAAVGSALIAVSSLSFLGLGVQAPDFDWGRMLTDGIGQFYTTPSVALAPAIMIAGTGLVMGWAGEAIARALNPRLWTANGGDGRKVAAQSTVDAPEPDESALLAVGDLHVRIPVEGGEVVPVNGVSFSQRPGEITGIVGESGSGKSLTALSIAQLTPYPGRIGAHTLTLGGDDLRTLTRKGLGTRMAMVFQDPMSSLNPALRIGTQLTEAVREHGIMDKAAARERALELLAEVNIPEPAKTMDRFPHELSGGMRQRVMIAMGLMTRPGLIIADEPTTALDVTTQAQVVTLLRSVNEHHGSAILLISHNIGVVAEICERVLVMYAGRVVEDISAQELAQGPHHPYTQALMAAVPTLDTSRDEPLAAIPGRPPEPGSPLPGCPFAPRCERAEDRCSVEEPPLIQITDRASAACWLVEEARVP